MNVDHTALFLALNRSRFVPGHDHEDGVKIFFDRPDKRPVSDGTMIEFNWPGIRPSFVKPWGLLSWVTNDRLRDLQQGDRLPDPFVPWTCPAKQTKFWTNRDKQLVCITRATILDPATGLRDEPDVRWLPE